jgi:hypothetical protein
MTDEMFEAKQWLRRVYVLSKRVESNERMLEVLKARVNTATAVYENKSGRGDREQAQKRREDALLDYIEQEDKVERSRNLLNRETGKVKKVIDRIDDKTVGDIMDLRYLKLLAWDDVVKVANYSRAQVFRFHAQGLEKAAVILREARR